jgi:DNA-binding transcriptional ArsR family regulator
VSLQDILREDQRLAVLRTLGEADGYRLNESVLKAALTTMALTVGQDDVRAHLTWLERQGLVRVERLPMPTTGELWVAVLTPAGDDVRRGRSFPGVKRAEPL